MADRAGPWPLRVAFAFGDERLAAHVCEAVSSEAELVYTAPIAEFDVARLAADHVAAVLVNVDAGAAGDGLEGHLGDAAVRVVFNDPEISATLEGWARARWLRHLMAKLRGDANVDPPRPDSARVARGSTAATLGELPAPPAVAEPAAMAGPADAVAMAVLPSIGQGEADPGDPAAPVVTPPAADQEDVAALESAPMVSAPTFDSVGEAGASADNEALAEPGVGSALDVDTEALSAMIDARLAEPEAPPVAGDLAVTWAIPPSAPVEAPATAPAVDAARSAAAEPLAREVVVSGDPADADILASLPSLDEWALVDPGAEPVATVRSHSGPSAAPPVPDGLGAGLELLPLDGQAPAHDKDDLVKHWLHESDGGQHADGGKA